MEDLEQINKLHAALRSLRAGEHRHETLDQATSEASEIEDAIKTETNAMALADFEEIASYISIDARSKFPDLANILATGEKLVSSFDENTDLETRSEILKISGAALDYLKAPSNRHVLLSMSLDLKSQDPEKFQGFRSYLIRQDEAFIPIFEAIDQEEVVIAMALGESSVSEIDGPVIR